MKVSTIGCTSLRPSQSSFKAREFDEDYDYPQKSDHPTGHFVKRALIASSVAVAGTFAAKGLSAKLLSKIKNDNIFAEKIGEKSLSFFNYLAKKVDGLNDTKKVQKQIKKVANKVEEEVKKFAAKGIDDKKVLDEFDKKPNQKVTELLELAKKQNSEAEVAEDVSGKLPKEIAEEVAAEATKHLSVTKAVNGIKKALSWVAGGTAAVESFKNADGDNLTNGEEVANAVVKLAETAVIGPT